MHNIRFPFIFGRKGGGELDILRFLSSTIIQNNLANILKQQQELKNLKDILISDLHLIIASENDLKIKNKLLNFS